MKQITAAGVALVPTVVVIGLFVGHAVADGTDPNAPIAGKASGVSTRAATIPPRVFAVVNADGTKSRGKAVASVARISTGVYDVRFNRNITGCAWTGSIGMEQTPFGGSTGAGTISTSGRAGTNNGIFVQTFNGTGSPTDEPFAVVVVCS